MMVTSSMCTSYGTSVGRDLMARVSGGILWHECREGSYGTSVGRDLMARVSGGIFYIVQLLLSERLGFGLYCLLISMTDCSLFSFIPPTPTLLFPSIHGSYIPATYSHSHRLLLHSHIHHCLYCQVLIYTAE